MHIDMLQLRKEIKEDEGTVLHAYKDSLGFLTIGTGRLIDPAKGGGISAFESDTLLDNDINKVIHELDVKLPWVSLMTDVRQRAIINMAFNLGVNGLLKFTKFLEALKAKNYVLASTEMLDSRWAKQVGKRATRLSEMIKKG